MSSAHLPGLVDRYLHVPAAYRAEQDADGKSVDDRLVDALARRPPPRSTTSARSSARQGDLAAFETQGRFIETPLQR